MRKITQRLVPLILVTTCAHVFASPVDGINIVQNGGSSGKLTAIISDEIPEFVSKRLGVLPDVNLYQGECGAVSRKIKRQAACVELNENGQIVTSVPDSHNSIKQTTFSFKNGRKRLNPKEEIALTKAIYMVLSGNKSSIFDTKLVYISKHSNGKYILRVSDYDGSSPVTIHESREPILTPSWSPNGKYLTYVSFESVRASIFVQEVQSKRRIKVITLRGLNAYPSFDSDSALLVSLSQEKPTSEIYRYDIQTGELKRMKRSGRADIFPKRINEETYLKVGLSSQDTPYAYVVEKGRQKPISSKPLNAISVSKNGDVVGLSGNNLVYLKKTDDGWDEMKYLAKGSSIESPSISQNGKSIYFSVQEKERVFIKMASNTGKNILSFRVNHEDLIQVSAL
ncbi:PD40 domain-containing protein [Photobacterium galatheae]|uniref:Translocation protein TolB n=1 Tax=Photobacterium galatheae TaxID=1654360 RepID=A0A066RP70_9GAMM|nr:PD40 domain-containing protein [Photobacterium galatheae]KDM90921.1 hypothetical protein EA58_14270 [Photobacterium galatheae]MCM0149115.1 PD40 domain-containing protein [Photobacterium galatheae]